MTRTGSDSDVVPLSHKKTEVVFGSSIIIRYRKMVIRSPFSYLSLGRHRVCMSLLIFYTPLGLDSFWKTVSQGRNSCSFILRLRRS